MKLGRTEKYVLQVFGILSLTSLVLLAVRMLLTGSSRYGFMPWNLILAWAGLIFGWNAARQLATGSARSWPVVGWVIVWLFFLPNTWYTLTDFLHVFPNGEISEIFDITLMSSFVWCSFLMGLVSLYLVHKQLIKRFTPNQTYAVAEVVILLSSFAIYLGRVLRWNSWDVITNPSAGS